MIILSMYDRTANGEAVSTSVTLDIDAIGVPIEAQDPDPRPFFVRAGLAQSHHKTAADAKQYARTMHAAYLKVNGGLAA